ncbi:MAG: hypothetical protein ABEH78_03510 [Haloferacaceae archaeon]
MDRRGVLAALTPLLAGCFGGGTVSSATTPDASTTAATGTPAGNGTATATPGPTETATATPEQTASASAAEEAATGHIETARERIGTAVETYADSGDITDVGADAEGFTPGDVYAALVRANSAVSRAGALAATDDQETTVARLEGVVAFLTRATAAQANVIEAHDALTASRRALVDGESGEVSARRAEVDAARKAAERALSHLTSEATADDMAAVDVLDAGDYETKREAFEASTTALADAVGAVSTFADGLELLAAARNRGENGDTAAAAEDAAGAESRFKEVASTFGDLVDGLPDAAGGFADLFTAFADLADEKASVAADLADQYG